MGYLVLQMIPFISAASLALMFLTDGVATFLVLTARFCGLGSLL